MTSARIDLASPLRRAGARQAVPETLQWTGTPQRPLSKSDILRGIDEFLMALPLGCAPGGHRWLGLRSTARTAPAAHALWRRACALL